MPAVRTKKKSVAKKPLKKTVKKATRSVKRKVIAKAKKKAVKKILNKVKMLGRVSHYYDNLGVAIIEVASPIRLGDVVVIRRGEHDLVQPITSLQIDHEPVKSAKKKDVVGLKVMQKVQPGAVVLPG